MHTNEEHQDVDLTHFINALFKGLSRFFSFIGAFIAYVLRNIWYAIVLLLAGIIIGYIWDASVSKPKYAEVIVQPNAGSTSYLYTTATLLNTKLQNQDKEYFEAQNFTGYEHINSIKVSPIVNVGDVLNNLKDYDDEQIMYYLKNNNIDDDYFDDDIFYREYKFHRLQIELDTQASQEDLSRFLSFINQGNSFYSTQLKSHQESLKTRIAANEYTINQIDTFVNRLSTSFTSSTNDASVFLGSQNSFNIAEIFEKKTTLLEENEDLQKDLLASQDLFQVINTPALVFSKKVTDLKVILLPVLFILIYLSILFLYFISKKNR